MNGFSAHFKRQRLSDWIFKKTQLLIISMKPSVNIQTLIDQKVKDRKRNIMLRNRKKAQIAVLMSDKVNFGMKNMIRDKEGHI